MKILSIEPTPSPNNMKLNLDETLPEGVRYAYTKDQLEEAPEHLQRILCIPGVRGVFQVTDFIAVERSSKADWEEILQQIGKAFGQNLPLSVVGTGDSQQEKYGEVEVLVQTFAHIPYQVKLIADGQEKRFALPPYFMEAVMTAQERSGHNLILGRQWEEHGVRYGDMEEIGQEVVQELIAAYDQERLQQLVEAAAQPQSGQASSPARSPDEIEEQLRHPDWQRRFAALQQMKLELSNLPYLVQALQDPKPSIRRLAVAYLGELNSPEVLPYLYQALQDDSPAIRRTAGDALSDMGDPRAIPAMIRALKDPSKIVRWRAARFLYEVGDDSAVPALQQALRDPEFEVRLQAKLALERITQGQEASGTVWQQMANRNATGNHQEKKAPPPSGQ